MRMARANVVRVSVDEAKWENRIVVENSIMNAKELRSILNENGGHEKDDCFYFHTNYSYRKAVQALCDKGAYVV